MIPSERKGLIFYFEDDYEGLEDYLNELQKHYEVVIGAHRALIEKLGGRPVDLVIVDLMIHNQSYDYKTEAEVDNIRLDGTVWNRRGLEFLRGIRRGDYQKWGFAPNVPVIVASAVVNYPAQEEAEKIGISEYLKKPFTIEQLEQAVEKALAK